LKQVMALRHYGRAPTWAVPIFRLEPERAGLKEKLGRIWIGVF